MFWANWRRWVATNIHLDQSSLLRKQWSPLHWVPGGEGKVIAESESWWSACLAGEVALLSLLKAITNLWLEGLDLFNQSGYFRWLCVEGIFVLCYNLVDLLLLDRRCLGETIVVAMFFCLPFEQIVEKMDFVVWDTTLWHCLGGAVVGTTSSIL